VRALLASLALLLVSAPAAFAQGEIDAVGEALRSDPVYVDPDAELAVSASEAEALRDKIRDAGEPIFIAVLPDSAGKAEKVAPQVAAAADRDGTYGVVVGRTLVGGPSSEAGNAAEDTVAAHQGDSAATVLNDFVDRVASGDGGGGDDGGGSGSGSGGGESGSGSSSGSNRSGSGDD
jgi:hypothetical protein